MAFSTGLYKHLRNVGVPNNEHRWTSGQTLGFVLDVPASGVVTIPDGNCREAGARHLRSAIAKGNGNGSLTVYETLPPGVCEGMQKLDT